MSREREAWEVITTREQLDALPVGSIVMALWCDMAVPNTFTRYSDGWFDTPHQPPKFPLGSGRHGESVLVLWHPAWAESLPAICSQCSMPEPAEWCWQQSSSCPFGKPPRSKP